MYRDELYGLMEGLSEELSLSADATEETVLANHFNNAESSDFTGADGVELSSSVHVREDGSTYSNELSEAGDLSQTTLEQALIDFSDFRDGGGKRIQIGAATLLAPKEEKFNADRLLNSSQTPDDNTNAINPMKGIVKPVIWNYLTDTDRWFLLSEKSNHSLTLYTREEPWTDYEYDFDTKDYKITLMYAQSSGWSDPKGVFCGRGV
jgi:hypothetical protein